LLTTDTAYTCGDDPVGLMFDKQDLGQSGNTWHSSGNGTWRGKYYEGGWALIKPWSKTPDGDFDLMARGVKEPIHPRRQA